jgi:hypothetical protein
MFKNLMKAAVGLVVETPIALVEDSVTMFGALNDKAEPATVTALKKVAQNVAEATEPKERR